MDMVDRVLEPVTLDGVNHLDAGVNPFIGYALEGFVVTPYLQWRPKGETIYVVSQSPLQPYNCNITLGVNPITADFKIGGTCLHTLAHFNYHQEHSDYLIVLNGGDYIEIGLVSDNTLFGVLDFYLCATFGA